MPSMAYNILFFIHIKSPSKIINSINTISYNVVVLAGTELAIIMSEPT